MPRYLGLLVVRALMYSLAVFSSISVGICIGKKVPPDSLYLWYLGGSFLMHAVLSSSHACLIAGKVPVSVTRVTSVPLPSPHINVAPQDTCASHV